MRITIITGPFGCLPPIAIGAVEKIWHKVGMYWISNGQDVVFISKCPPMEMKEDANHIYIKGYDKSVNYIKDLFHDFVYSFRALYRMPKTDIVVLNTIWSPILCLFFKWKFKGVLYNVARFPKKQMGLYRNVDCLSCVSTPIKEAVLMQSPSVKNIVCVIPNPIDTSIYHMREDKSLKNCLSVVYTGRIHREKGIDLLVKAVSILKDRYDVRLKLIGATRIEDGGSGDEYVAYLNECDTHGVIDWIPPIYKPIELANEMSKGDVYCYPSVAETGESFGCAPLEAMALGMPTIVSDLDCFKDFITDGVNGLIFNHRSSNAISELANCIEMIIQNQDLKDRLAEQASKMSLKYSVDAIANQYMVVFKKILNHVKVTD